MEITNYYIKLPYLYRENSDVLIRVENVLKNLTTFLMNKMLSLCLKLFISTTKLLVKMLLNSLNLTFLFSPYRFNIESINIKNECSQFKNNHPEYISLCKRLDVFCLQFPIATKSQHLAFYVPENGIYTWAYLK